jgi:hypothetical protein
LKNITYLCTRLVEVTTLANGKKFLRKVFQKKNFKNIWRLEKFDLPLQPISATKWDG